MTACSVKEQYGSELVTSPENKQEGVKLEFTATTGIETETKTTLIQDGELPGGQPKMITWWCPEEEICIYYGASSGNKFTSTNTELVQTATFSGTLNAFTGLNESGDFNYFWAVYPYDAAVSCDGESVVAILADEQEAYAGSYANNTNVTIAKSAGLSLGFYNVCSYLRFTVEKEGVISATFSGNNNEYVAGQFRVSMDNNGRPTAPVIIDGERSVTLRRPNNEPFVVGTSYYFTILPQTFENGFTVQFDTETASGSRVINASATFARNSINYGVTAFDHNVVYTSVIPNDEIWYTSTNGSSITPARTDNWGQSIVSYGTHGDYKVIKFSGAITTVPYNAFLNKTTLRKVYLPDGVTTVANSAFKGCTNLTKVVVPDNLGSIEYQAFFGCSSLASINFTTSITSIGSYSFAGCALTDIALPNNAAVYEAAFSQSSTLHSVVLPSNLTIVNNSLFSTCPNLESVTIPSGVTSIGDSAFHGCSSLESIVLPANLESIGNRAFQACSSLTSVTIPNNVTTIGQYAFQNTPISSVSLPSTIETVGSGAFHGCSNLSTVTLNTPNVRFGDVFMNAPIEEILGNYASANGLYYIDGNTLKGFAKAAGITNVVVPSNFTAIDRYAFSYCSGITSITLPAGLTSIGIYAFAYCSGLTSITFPSTVNSLGSCLMEDCSSLTSITVLATTPPTGGNAMFSSTNNYPIYVPAESLTTYKTTTKWNSYASRISSIPLAPPVAVDLGLSVKWANVNVGAGQDWEYGLFYAWGEIEYKNGFSSHNYKWCPSGSEYSATMKLTRYCPSSYTAYWDGDGSPDNVLDYSGYSYADDVARVTYGGTWRTPTKDEWEELMSSSNCDWEWTTRGGHNGYLVTSKKAGYTDKSIFLPAAGYSCDGYITGAGTNGYYWDSSISSVSPTTAWSLSFTSSDKTSSILGRHGGQSVRAVCQ